MRGIIGRLNRSAPFRIVAGILLAWRLGRLGSGVGWPDADGFLADGHVPFTPVQVKACAGWFPLKPFGRR